MSNFRVGDRVKVIFSGCSAHLRNGTIIDCITHLPDREGDAELFYHIRIDNEFGTRGFRGKRLQPLQPQNWNKPDFEF